MRQAASFLPFVPYGYRGEHAACGLCGSARSRLIARYDRRLKPLRTVACLGCGLVRCDPMPTEDELQEYYSHRYRQDYQLAGRSPPRFHTVRSQREARARLRSLEPVLRPSSRILDFGAGSGEFLAQARAAGHQVTGIEPGCAYAAFARRRYDVEVIASAWQNVELPDKSFDLITANHVVEHLRDPVAALRRLTRWLADDGVVHVAVPDVLSRSGHRFQHLHFAHVYNFSNQTLTWAALSAGLESDPRVPAAGTSMIFRKCSGGPLQEPWQMSGAVPERPYACDGSPLAFLLGGTWISQAARRGIKALRDHRAVAEDC